MNLASAEAAQRRQETKKRLEALGWKFTSAKLADAALVCAIGPETDTFRRDHYEQALDAALKFASHAQARAEAGKEKSK